MLSRVGKVGRVFYSSLQKNFLFFYGSSFVAKLILSYNFRSRVANILPNYF